ncbi:aminobenzoyl-glutamate utilization protein B [Stachybotrys elegans]|uniref:Peptidase M20 domain-containing protein 2 n=1 Tax=Stachybotrys elegans TaxID=80388 RepID=A0A8K0T4E8_9HYPO|nr:aminobenzoyl-glutamate utilization protein B [Stachybotrys elegans]
MLRLPVFTTLLGLAQATAGELHPRNVSVSPYFNAVSDFIDNIQDQIWPINQEIHENPELGWEEERAHQLLTDFMQDQEGWRVTKGVYNISTAFVAVFDGDANQAGPVVSFNAEYDALPQLGHACGHNLIASSSVAAALATAKIMQEKGLGGKVVLFGTPAEESLGGKIRMLEANVFTDHKIDVSIMAHPSTSDTPYAITSSTDRLDLEYIGKEAHASASPYEGINAQDALILAYNAISMLRQQSVSTDQIHGIITSGGSRVNVIPNLATASFQIRSNDEASLEVWTNRLMDCFEAGAIATGATLNLTMRPYGYANMVTNEVMAKSYAKWFTGVGGTLPDPVVDKLREPAGSTDQGDVSHAFPAIHPFFEIVTANGTVPVTGPHTTAFEVASGSRPAFERAMRAAKGLAGVAVDILTTDGMMDDIREEFETQNLAKRLVKSLYIQRR